ncbi:DBH-like monooxygenase protein 1 [Halocaridina rubra]|uniref:DBH-like monooxygenase protein 1 n=1 Tax=Halocaridina rubra TaxID=373956 RepID=A0AAN9A5A1_HALRR
MDNSGLRLYYTEKLRKYDASSIIVGADVNPNIVIPPGQKQWFTVGRCDGECTKAAIPPSGINVFSALLHAHLLGSSLKLRHIRDGKELPPVFEDKSYDFNYQQMRVPKDEMKIFPGDSFLMECGYDSRKREKPSYGGIGTNEEMCVAYLSYYPKVNLSMCYSRPSIQSLYESVGIQDIYHKDRVINWAFDMRGKTDEEKDQKIAKNMRQKDYKPKLNSFEFRELHKSVMAKDPESKFA